MACVFCNILENEKQQIIEENKLFFVINDKYPLNEGHVLVIPKRHFVDFFAMNNEEWSSSREILFRTKSMLDKKYNPSGYNIGVNVGHDAGQSVFHAHIHIIPRYPGDIDDPGPEKKKVNMPLFEFMRDNEIFKKIIYSQIAQRKLDQVIASSNKESLNDIKGDKQYLEELKRKLKERVNSFCKDPKPEDYDNIIQTLELISIINE